MNKPKYIVIKKDLQDKIENGYYSLGSKIPTEYDLRQKYDVSRHTIRESISKLVNEGYLIKRHGSGTYVTDAYKLSRRTHGKKVIGVITTYLSDYIFPSIIRGIEEELSEYNYSLMLSSTNNNVDNERKSLRDMLEQNIKGLIIEPTKSSNVNPNLNYYTRIMQKEIPMIMLHAKYDELNIPMIGMDDVKAGYMATEYLINNGHKNIMIIIKTDDLQGKKRLKGFMQAHIDNDLIVNESHIMTFDTETVEELKIKINDSLNQEILPTGIVCYNDQVASTLIQEIQLNGFNVPEDFSIVSHDNSHLSSTIPGLNFTSVIHPKEEMGKQAARWIINVVENPKSNQESIIFEPKLKIGNTVKNI